MGGLSIREVWQTLTDALHQRGWTGIHPKRDILAILKGLITARQLSELSGVPRFVEHAYHGFCLPELVKSVRAQAPDLDLELAAGLRTYLNGKVLFVIVTSDARPSHPRACTLTAWQVCIQAVQHLLG